MVDSIPVTDIGDIHIDKAKFYPLYRIIKIRYDKLTMWARFSPRGQPRLSLLEVSDNLNEHENFNRIVQKLSMAVFNKRVDI